MARPHSAFVLTRTGVMETEFDRGSSLPRLRRGSGGVVWYPAHRKRRIHVLSAEGAEYVAALFSFEIFPGVDVLDLVDLPYLLSHPTDTRIGEVLLALSALEDNAPGNLLLQVRRQELGCRLLRAILSVAPRHAAAEERLSGLPQLMPALTYLEAHYTEPFRVADLAAAAGQSVVQFHRRFRAVTGTTPFEYGKRMRLQLASDLLLETDLSVAQVGERVGWPDPFHFSRTFKGVYGLSPAVYRRHPDRVG